MSKSGVKPVEIKPDEKPKTKRQMLDEIGIDAICERIESGESDGEIARSLGMSTGTVNQWLNRPENAVRSARARESSAESWLDRGLETIASALRREAGIDASAARAYAQECARRAAIRNPRYRDKVSVDADVTVTELTPAERAERIALLTAKLHGTNK